MPLDVNNLFKDGNKRVRAKDMQRELSRACGKGDNLSLFFKSARRERLFPSMIQYEIVRIRTPAIVSKLQDCLSYQEPLV